MLVHELGHMLGLPEHGGNDRKTHAVSDRDPNQQPNAVLDRGSDRWPDACKNRPQRQDQEEDPQAEQDSLSNRGTDDRPYRWPRYYCECRSPKGTDSISNDCRSHQETSKDPGNDDPDRRH